MKHILKDFSLDNRYFRIYVKLMERGINRNKKVGTFEHHHYVPQAFFITPSSDRSSRSNQFGWLDGNPDEPENLVMLTPKEHYIAHLLLPAFLTGYPKSIMLTAYILYSNARGQHKIGSRTYQKMREEYSSFRSELVTGERNPMYGKRSASKGKRWIKNGEKELLVSKEDAEHYLDLGWELGRPNIDGRLNGRPRYGQENPRFGKPSHNRGQKGVYTHDDATRAKIKISIERRKEKGTYVNAMKGKQSAVKGRKWVFNDHEDIMIPSHQIDEYIERGYQLGRRNFPTRRSNKSNLTDML